MNYVLKSQHIFTGLKDFTEPGAILIEDSLIKQVAPSIEELTLRGDEQIIDLGEQLITPGLHDFHVHLFTGALQLVCVDLHDTKSADEVIQKVKNYAANHTKAWIIGFGWDNGGWKVDTLPTKEMLDEHFPNRPVLLNHLECHYCWVNSAALELAEITATTKNPDFGEIVRASNGEATGILIEKAQDLVQKIAYSFSEEEKLAMLHAFFDLTARSGITSINDMYAPFSEFLDDFSLLFQLEKEQKLKARVYLQPRMDGDLTEAHHFKQLYQHPKIKMNGLKQFVDGVITGHTAYMVEPYADANHTGMTTYDLKAMKKWIIEADKEGFSVRLHAIGDGAVKFSLDAFEEARRINGHMGTRHTIEHVECIQPEDVTRFKKLDVIASVQPYHIAALEQKVYLERLGEKRFNRTYFSKTLLNSGAKVAFGSDFPVVSIDPMREIYHAVTRMDSTYRQQWGPDEKTTMAETLRAYTQVPAYGCFNEDKGGTIEAGKYADIVAFDRNLFSIAPKDILTTKVSMTMLNGDIIFERKPASSLT